MEPTEYHLRITPRTVLGLTRFYRRSFWALVEILKQNGIELDELKDPAYEAALEVLESRYKETSECLNGKQQEEE